MQRKYTVLKQICNFIPPYLVERLAKQYGIDKQSRTFSPWSHVVALLYAQLTHAAGLNDVCDGLQLNCGALAAIRGAVPPARNTFSHANKIRSWQMARQLYWAVMEQLVNESPRFASGKLRQGYLRRFKHAIHVADSTTIQLVANCLDWARHRRRKAAAKCHLRLNMQSFLPGYVVVAPARVHDSAKAWELCAGLESGEISIFDKAYLDFEHLNELNERGIWWVTRAKDNMRYKVIERLGCGNNPKVLRDEIVELENYQSLRLYPQYMRRVEAIVEVDGEERVMVFLTNNFEWSAWTVCELYRCRWEIEVFFKELKQTVQFCDFLGHNANAVYWQIWIGLLVHLLMRYLAYLSSWRHSFKRLFGVVRAIVWRYYKLMDILLCYGTAKPPWRLRAAPEQLYLPGFG